MESRNFKKLTFIIFAIILNLTLVKGENNFNLQGNQVIYICTGQYAYAYHSRSDCPGLGNCKGDIQYTDEYTAVNSLKRVPCCRCWSNVGGRCNDDNPYYSSTGGANADGYLYVALAIVAASAILLSNDIYLYPTYSFSNGIGNNYYGETGIGWTFGFRKKLKHSALEYGASFLKYSTIYLNTNNPYTEYDYITYEYARWAGHFNYVHQIYYNSTPYWMKVYLGPTINYGNGFGYGGIVGTEMKILDRLKFDIRYELTTKTNQIQLGLIFTYQKKYFWQK
jgi:hypothetical protein